MLNRDVCVWLNDATVDLAYDFFDEIWTDWGAASKTMVTYTKREVDGGVFWDVSISSEGHDEVVLASVSQVDFNVSDYVPFFKVGTASDIAPTVVEVSSQAVPEPGACADVFCALALLAAVYRKKK